MRRRHMPGARKDTTPITAEFPQYTGRSADLGDFTVAFETIGVGDHDLAPLFKGLPDDRCPCPHWGLVVSGRLTIRYRDHEETYEAGDAFYLPPGHLPLAGPGAELITFSPTAKWKDVNAVMAKNIEILKS
jgi:hypothetical protein